MERVKDWTYKVIKKIRAGGFGKVHECGNVITGLKVAIKRINLLNDLDGVPSHIIREISILKELQHDNIIRLLDVPSSKKYAYLVIKDLDLELRSFITRQRIL